MNGLEFSFFIGDGRGMAKGFYQALFLTRSGPTLNVNLTFTCFYMPLNFVDFTCQYLRKNIKKEGLNDQEAKMFKKIIRDLLGKFSASMCKENLIFRRFFLQLKLLIRVDPFVTNYVILVFQQIN